MKLAFSLCCLIYQAEMANCIWNPQQTGLGTPKYGAAAYASLLYLLIF